MTVATTDGERLWAFRYSSEGRSRSLFHSTDVSTLRHQYPDNPVLHNLSDQARLVVSEPLGDLKGAWREVPEGTCVILSGAGTSCGRSRPILAEPASPPPGPDRIGRPWTPPPSRGPVPGGRRAGRRGGSPASSSSERFSRATTFRTLQTGLCFLIGAVLLLPEAARASATGA